MHFVVTALDYTDEEAISRRLAHRDAHLTGVKELISQGRFLSGGAILDDNEKMIGSTLHLEFPDKASLLEQIQKDPYISGKVWENIDVKAARFVPLK